MPWSPGSSWFCTNTQRNLDNNIPVYTNHRVFQVREKMRPLRLMEASALFNGKLALPMRLIRPFLSRGWKDETSPYLWLLWRRRYPRGKSGLRYAPFWGWTINIVYVLLNCTVMRCLLCIYITWLQQLFVWSSAWASPSNTGCFKNVIRAHPGF